MQTTSIRRKTYSVHIAYQTELTTGQLLLLVPLHELHNTQLLYRAAQKHLERLFGTNNNRRFFFRVVWNELYDTRPTTFTKSYLPSSSIKDVSTVPVSTVDTEEMTIA